MESTENVEISRATSRFTALNGLKIQDKAEFMSLVRNNFGAKALSPHYGLKIVRDLHGKMQETLTCVGLFLLFNYRLLKST